MRIRTVSITVLSAAMLFFIAGPGLAASVATKKLELKKAFMLRNIDDLGRTLEFARDATAALEEQLAALNLAGAGSLASESYAHAERFLNYPKRLMSLTMEFEQSFNNFVTLQADSRIGGDRYVELAEAAQGVIDALGNWFEKLEKEREAIESRMERLDKGVTEKRLLIDVTDLELARELWPDYQDRFQYYGEAIYRDLTADELVRLQLELWQLQSRQPLYAGLSDFIRSERRWWAFKADEFRKIRELAEAFDDDEPGKLDDALQSTIRIYATSIPAMERHQDELFAANQRLPRSGTLGVLEYQKALQNYYDSAMTRYERHILWLEGEVGVLRIDLVELASQRRQEAETARLNNPVTVQ